MFCTNPMNSNLTKLHKHQDTRVKDNTNLGFLVACTEGLGAYPHCCQSQKKTGLLKQPCSMCFDQSGSEYTVCMPALLIKILCTVLKMFPLVISLSTLLNLRFQTPKL